MEVTTTTTTQAPRSPVKTAQQLSDTSEMSVTALATSTSAMASTHIAPGPLDLPSRAGRLGVSRIDLPSSQATSNPVGEPATGALSSDDENQQRADQMVFSQAVLRTGWLWKKGGRTLKMWKRRWFVLRRDCFSYYQDNQEIEARKVVLVDDISGIAYKDISHKPHVCFWVGPKEIHLQARSTDDAKEWVRMLKLAVHGPDTTQQSPIEPNTGNTTTKTTEMPPPPTRRIGTSTSVPQLNMPLESPRAAPQHADASFRSRQSSIADLASPFPATVPEDDYMSPGDFSDNDLHLTTSGEQLRSAAAHVQPPLERTDTAQSGPDIQNGGMPTSFTLRAADAGDKVVTQGWLRRRHQRTGRWSRKVWVVLRSNGLYVYPERDEYKAMLVLPFKREIIDVSELEPLTLGKGRHSRYCFQVITKTRALRFSCESEEELDRWLGGMKSRIVHTL